MALPSGGRGASLQEGKKLPRRRNAWALAQVDSSERPPMINQGAARRGRGHARGLAALITSRAAENEVRETRYTKGHRSVPLCSFVCLKHLHPFLFRFQRLLLPTDVCVAVSLSTAAVLFMVDFRDINGKVGATGGRHGLQRPESNAARFSRPIEGNN